LRLAEAATRPDASILAAIGSAGPIERTADNFPYFRVAVDQLAALLNYEEDDAVKSDTVKAFHLLARFGEVAGSQGRQPLLDYEVHTLYEANLAALSAFLSTLAEFYSKYSHDATPLLVPYTRFCERGTFEKNAHDTEACLRDLRLTDVYK